MKQTRIEPRRYYAPTGGLPDQATLHTGRAVFTEAYAVIPKGVFSDIVTSPLPFWEKTRAWIIARPLSGFAETFSQYVMEVGPGGGSDRPEPDAGAEAALFVTEGELALTLDGAGHRLAPGGFAYVPPGRTWSLTNPGTAPARFHWIRKAYEAVDGLPAPEPVIADETAITPTPMPGTEERWATTRFVDPADLRHDMHVTVVTFQPGGVIPFEETHVMEHGLYVLEGKAVYRLNRDWVEVEAGDFMWLRAFCPQACYAGGPGRFRYLLYKDVNRHPEAEARPMTETLSRTLTLEPLTAEAFAPWGDVIEASGESFPINGGMCDRFHDRARMEFTGEGGRAGISVGWGRPYPLPHRFDLVERHPLGSQAFVPMTEDPFLVVVAPDEDGRPGTPRAFITRPGQGINYLRNVWHGVLTPLGRATPFVIVDRIGPGVNLEEYRYDTEWNVVTS